MNENATTEIQEEIEAFYNGEPNHFAVEIAEGVWFDADNPFEEDLMEPTMMASVLLEPDSPYNVGVPKQHTSLSRYSGFGDTVMADVVSQAVHDAGGEFQELVFEYSSNNSNEEIGFLVFLGSIPNDRVVYDWKNGEMVEKAEYAL